MGRDKMKEAKADLGYGYKTIMDSLEEKVSVFFHEDFDDSDCSFEVEESDYEPEGMNMHDSLERTLFWESQDALIQELLDRYSSTGSKLRQEISRIIGIAKRAQHLCNCLKPNFDGCTNCLRRRVVNLLCQKGLNAKLCTSEWTHTKHLPGGKHEYIEVMASTIGSKKQVPYLVELEFKDQFKIAKACDEYRQLVASLPEYYIGKPKYLNAIVGVLCDAAQRSMKEKKLHMGPWRKRNFMQMKWCASEKRSVDESCLQCHAAPAVIVA